LLIYRIDTEQAYYHYGANQHGEQTVDNVFTIRRQLRPSNRAFAANSSLLFGVASVRPRGLPAVSGCNHSGTLYQMVRGREAADWICRAGIARDQKSLAAATAEVLRPALAASTGFGHPLFTAKALERGRLAPYPLERTLANIVKGHPRNHSRGMTRKHLTGRVDQN